MSLIQQALPDSSDFMLPGPPSRNNGGSADLISTGLLAYAAGSTVPIVDIRSMQLVSVFPIPPPASSSSSSSLSPFVTSVRWCPTTLRLDMLSNDATSNAHAHSHLLLAAGDRQGRICLLDFRVKSFPCMFLETDHEILKLGIQDLCWIQARTDSWIIAALSGPCILSLYNIYTKRCFFKYDVTTHDIFCSIKRDPFDSRHFCVVGLRGLLFSIKVYGDVSESEVVLEEHKIVTDVSELSKLEREGVGGMVNTNTPASAMFPSYAVKLAFSPHWKHILYVVFPRELVVFDLQYETPLSRAKLPRRCGKFLDVLPDPSMGLLYCAHFDGRLTAWRCKE